MPEKAETRGKSHEVLVPRLMFDPEWFKMRDGILMFTKATNRSRGGDIWGIWVWW